MKIVFSIAHEQCNNLRKQTNASGLVSGWLTLLSLPI